MTHPGQSAVTDGPILAAPSSSAWLQAVLADFDAFLADHAANERKASAMAMTMVVHYPDRDLLVSRMIDLAVEELNHFRQVVRLMQTRGLVMPPDEKDPYINQLRSHHRKGSDEYLLDRLLSAAVIEARGEERFRLIADAVPDRELGSFYQALANSEQGHHQLFIEMARQYFPEKTVDSRLAQWIALETAIIESLPVRSRLH
ncbi:MAG: tRNA-(ms[2]io[6]A)-hydroxylase [Proteobacteria bacterium]|nr:tRNA-(ms[2]io[6]A)-hydroxylase [Pseudomonadota bacterium]